MLVVLIRRQERRALQQRKAGAGADADADKSSGDDDDASLDRLFDGRYDWMVLVKRCWKSRVPIVGVFVEVAPGGEQIE